jgi:hypothetical protein
LDVVFSERSDYTFLNLLGDVGALNDVLFRFAELGLMNILFMNIFLENTLIEKIFTTRKKDGKFK